MDKLIKSLQNKMKKLGWSNEHLAELSGVDHSVILGLVKGSVKPTSRFSETVRLFETIENDLRIIRRQRQPKISPVKRARLRRRKQNMISSLKNKLSEKPTQHEVSSFESEKGSKPWSRKFERCIDCGTTEEKHESHGLCYTCYWIERRMTHRSPDRKHGMASKKLTKEYLFEEHIIKKKSVSDIAEECNCSKHSVYNKLRAHQIPLRGKRIKVDEGFFSSWSPKMAYVLGVIYTDGNLWYDKKKGGAWISIAQKDPELPNKIKALMKCNAKLAYVPKRTHKSGVVSGELYIFRINNRKIFTDLLNLGLTPDKSLLVDFPDVPPECVRHFIRGCWDGDGSVYIEKRGRRIRASYQSASLSFIKGMLNELEKEGFPSRTIYETKRKNTSYSFKFSHSQCEKLYHYLYDDVPPDQYLKRKHDVFWNYFY